MDKLPTLSPRQIKPGDRLIRKDDHLQREDADAEVIAKTNCAPTCFILRGYFTRWETARSLCAQGYTEVEREGQVIGTFFVKYW